MLLKIIDSVLVVGIAEISRDFTVRKADNQTSSTYIYFDKRKQEQCIFASQLLYRRYCFFVKSNGKGCCWGKKSPNCSGNVSWTLASTNVWPQDFQAPASL